MAAICSLLFAFLQFSYLSVHARNSSNHSFTPIPRDLYHSSDGLIEEIKALVGRHSNRLTLETLRAGNKGYFTEIVVVTYRHGGKDTDDNSKFRILLSFGQHGRELITSEVALQLLSILSEEHQMPDMNPISLNNTLEKLLIKVVPMENLNGRRLVEAGEICERRNGRGVDLNRNWGVDWGKKDKDYDPYEENPGTAPFSEPETQIMRKLSKSFDPHIWVNVHSGMEALFMPYDHRNTTPDGTASRIMRSMLEDLNRLHCQDRCLVGSGGGSVGYLAHGTSTDYMYDIVKVPMAFTFEIYGDLQASSKDCFRMFNPSDTPTFDLAAVLHRCRHACQRRTHCRSLRVLRDWCALFFSIFATGPREFRKIHSKLAIDLGRWVALDRYEDRRVMGRSKGGEILESLELGIQEMRTYFRLFLVSTVLLMFMFCSRISKSKCKQHIPSIAI